jgi:hypothetical protein
MRSCASILKRETISTASWNFLAFALENHAIADSEAADLRFRINESSLDKFNAQAPWRAETFAHIGIRQSRRLLSGCPKIHTKSLGAAAALTPRSVYWFTSPRLAGMAICCFRRDAVISSCGERSRYLSLSLQLRLARLLSQRVPIYSASHAARN